MDTNQSSSVLEVKGGKTVPNKVERLAKEDVMPSWFATQSLLLSQSTNSCTHANTAVVAPLFKSSPRDRTLYTVLQLTRYFCSSSWPPKKDSHNTGSWPLYTYTENLTISRKYQLHGSKELVLSTFHLMLYMLLQKQSVEVKLALCTIESGAYTSAALLGSFRAKNRPV